MPRVRCIGLDLAWAPHNPSGVAILDGDSRRAYLSESATLADDASIITYLTPFLNTTSALIIAVDAPLRVPNQTGARPAERELARVFGRFQAGAHPANRQLVAYDGVVRGERLVEALAAYGIVERPNIAAQEPTRQITEVYPHAAMVALHGLTRTLKYKRRSADRAFWLNEWQRFHDFLRALATADPALWLPDTFLLDDITVLRGRALQDYEDLLDSVVCAYSVLYGFRWGMVRCHSFGSLEAGHIFTPLPPHLWT